MVEKDKVINELKKLKLGEKYNNDGLNHCLNILEHILNYQSIDYSNLKQTIMYPRSKDCIKKDVENLLKAQIIIDKSNGNYEIISKYIG